MVFPWRALEVVLLEAVFGQLFVFRSGTAVVGIGIDADAASGGEESGHFDVFGVHEADEVLHDDIDDVLVEIAVVAEAHEVELQRLALDHPAARDVRDIDGRIVRLARDGAERRELRAVELDPVIIVRMTVLERLEDLRTVIVVVFDIFLAEERDVLLGFIA